MIELFFLLSAVFSIVVIVFLVIFFTEDSINQKYCYQEVVKLLRTTKIVFAIQAVLYITMCFITAVYYPDNTALWITSFGMMGVLIRLVFTHNLLRDTRLFKLDTRFRSICRWFYQELDKEGDKLYYTITCFEEVTDSKDKSWILTLDGGAFETNVRLLISTEFKQVVETAKAHYKNAIRDSFGYQETTKYFYTNKHK
jgi:hypothetical protein